MNRAIANWIKGTVFEGSERDEDDGRSSGYCSECKDLGLPTCVNRLLSFYAVKRDCCRPKDA